MTTQRVTKVISHDARAVRAIEAMRVRAQIAIDKYDVTDDEIDALIESAEITEAIDNFYRQLNAVIYPVLRAKKMRASSTTDNVASEITGRVIKTRLHNWYI